MAAIAPIPRTPGDRSIDALWLYAEEMERELMHLAANIEADNIKDGAISAEKLGGAVNSELARVRQSVAQLKEIIRKARDYAILENKPKINSVELDGNKSLSDIGAQPAGTYAGLDSPDFTGTPTAPTAAAGTSTTQIATTAFVQAAVDAAALIDADMGTVDSLPVTKAVSGVTADMKVVAWEFGAPGAFAGPLTVTTAAGRVTLSGTIFGSSTVRLTLAKVDGVEGT